MANTAKTDIRKIAARQRERKALELRKAGATYEDIAKQVGYANKACAYTAIKGAIKDIIREPAEEVLQLELTRLDVLLLGCWQKAKNGDPHAVDRALKIMERRASYLGLDAPKKTAATVEGAMTFTDGAHEELLARIAGLVASTAPGEGDPGPNTG